MKLDSADLALGIALGIIALAGVVATIGVIVAGKGAAAAWDQSRIECSERGGVNVSDRSGFYCYNQETGARIIVPSEIVK